MVNKFFEKSREKLLIAAHRGFSAGNIPCNTIAAFEAALFCGADMLEIDITKSADGELFVFHPGLERMHLGIDEHLETMTASAIRALVYRNADGTKTQYPVSTLDEVFEQFRSRCFINIDKFWSNAPDITACVRRHNMADDVVVKTFPADECLDLLEQVAPDIPYIPFLCNEDEYTEDLLKRDIRLVGAEAHFYEDDSEVCSPEYIEAMHRRGLIVWANAIVFNYRTVESSGHTDDVSVTGNPAAGWGWLAERGFDILQTDWVGPMVNWLDKNALLTR